MQSKEVPVQMNTPTGEIAPVASEATVERPNRTIYDEPKVQIKAANVIDQTVLNDREMIENRLGCLSMEKWFRLMVTIFHCQMNMVIPATVICQKALGLSAQHSTSLVIQLMNRLLSTSLQLFDDQKLTPEQFKTVESFVKANDAKITLGVDRSGNNTDNVEKNRN